MSRFDRRHMLKVMAATAAGAAAAGAAVGRAGIESVLAASPAPGGGSILGTQASSPAASAPRSLATTPFTTYQGFPGSDFDAGRSTFTWSVSGTIKFATNGGFYVRRLQLPQAAVLTECIAYLVQPTVPSVICYVLSCNLGTNTTSILGSANTLTTSGSVQALSMSVTPTYINNTSFWYELFFDCGAATDNQIWGARIGYLNEPGLTLFPDPRRCLGNGTTTLAEAFILNIDATLKSTAGGGPTGVPAGAKAAFCAVQAYQPGVMTLYPAGTGDTGTANWSVQGTSGQLQMLYMLVPLDSTGKFNIHNRFTDKQIYVDVWGYLM